MYLLVILIGVSTQPIPEPTEDACYKAAERIIKAFGSRVHGFACVPTVGKP